MLKDDGVVLSQPVVEFGDWHIAAQNGGFAVLPMRSDARPAAICGVQVVALAADLPDAAVTQAIVHLQKSRQAYQSDCYHAWRCLRPGGRLLIVGGNDLGIVSALKKWKQWSLAMPEVLANRARARVGCVAKTDQGGPALPDRATFMVDDLPFVSPAGTFSQGKFDCGSRLLLDCLQQADPNPSRLMDCGAGVGPLAVYAARRWPACSVRALEVHAVSCRAIEANAEANGVAHQVVVEWWDAEYPGEPQPVDCVLCNPPFHTGKAVDYGPALAMFRYARDCLRLSDHQSKQLWIVANQHLPYEQHLRQWALGVEQITVAQGFKVLCVQVA